MQVTFLPWMELFTVFQESGPEIPVLLVHNFISHHPQDEELPNFVAEK
jgi:hypothetical protein